MAYHNGEKERAFFKEIPIGEPTEGIGCQEATSTPKENYFHSIFTSMSMRNDIEERLKRRFEELCPKDKNLEHLHEIINSLYSMYLQILPEQLRRRERGATRDMLLTLQSANNFMHMLYDTFSYHETTKK